MHGHRRLVHDPVVDALQPVLVPAEHLVVLFDEGPRLHGRVGADVKFLGALERVEELDGAVHRPAAALVDLEPDRDVDVRREGDRVALLVPLAVEVVHHDVEPRFVVLRVVEDMHQVGPGSHVRVLQAFGDAPLDLLGRVRLQHAGLDAVGEGPAGVAPAALAGCARHEPHDAAVVRGLVEVVVAAADEDGLEGRRALGRGQYLHRAEVGDADHADVAVAPGLGRDPLDEVVGVLAQRDAAGVVVADVLALGRAGAPQVADDVDVALLDDARDVAGLDAAVPHGAGPTLRRGGQREGLEFLAVRAQGHESGPGGVAEAAVGVGREGDAVAHRDTEVLADGDALCARADRLGVGHEEVLLSHEFWLRRR